MHVLKCNESERQREGETVGRGGERKKEGERDERVGGGGKREGDTYSSKTIHNI